ncbi:MAG: hypothetical protein KIT11_05920 [Fimbriimonadaceae bacterium]|nr:hypothetical protein [Fimbriimonadaceae bacterium]QYK55894.1 MAG: hypothetical protein KF733_00110 [Fimbriimonadaceae bacterium]
MTTRIEGTLSGPIGAARNSGPELRSDFRQSLETALNGWLGQVSRSPIVGAAKAVEQVASGGKLDLSKLSETTRRDLVKLQSAAEGLEGFFIKGLLEQAQKVKFVEDKSPMGDFARDLMNQAVADAVAKRAPGLGMAKMVFVQTAGQIVKSAASRPTPTTENNP